MKKAKKPGKKPETVKLDDDWRDAMRRALKKPRPEEGWPEPEKPEKKPKSE